MSHSKVKRVLILISSVVVSGTVVWFWPWLVFAILTGAVLSLIWASRKAQWYTREAGYFEARVQTFMSLEEAIRRDMNLAEWLQAEMERDTMRAELHHPPRLWPRKVKR